MEARKYFSLEEMKDKHIGKIGTAERDAYEAELQEHLIGEAIKKVRLSKGLTQEELGQKIGVQRSQISKIESGKNITIATIAKVLRAMDINASLDMGSQGSFALW